MNEEQKFLHQLLVDYARHIKKAFAPAFDLFEESSIDKSAKEFILLKQAQDDLDKDAQSRDFESAAHEVAAKNKAEAEARAKAEAEAKAKRDAEQRAADEQAAKDAAEAKALQDSRDKEDAENAARKIAEEKAARDAKDLA